MMKNLLIATLLFSAVASNAEDNSNLDKHAETMLVALTEGTLQAKLDAACMWNIDKRNNRQIANKDECLKEANSQIDEIKDAPQLAEYAAWVEKFKVDNKLAASLK